MKIKNFSEYEKLNEEINLNFLNPRNKKNYSLADKKYLEKLAGTEPEGIDYKIKKLKNFLYGFPNDTTYWSDATDEIRDMARKSKEIYNEIDLDVLEDDEKALQPLDFRQLKTPSEWNRKGKEYIMNTLNLMSDRAKNEFFDYFSDWLK